MKNAILIAELEVKKKVWNYCQCDQLSYNAERELLDTKLGKYALRVCAGKVTLAKDEDSFQGDTIDTYTKAVINLEGLESSTEAMLKLLMAIENIEIWSPENTDWFEE